jgi:hypothetical protein
MSHNKKRNAGIIYELLVRAVSAYLVENDKAKAQVALNILSTHFNKKSELYKEFRVFHALTKSTVQDSSIAAAILTESKQSSRRIDSRKLDKEKSSLIKEVNYTLKDPDFYYRNVPEYREFATVQSLINAWREGDRSNLTEMVILESKMIEFLTSSKQQIQEEVEVNPNVDALVVKIMNEKFNNKYASKLTKEQKDLIQDYVFSLQSNTHEFISERARSIQISAVERLRELKKAEKNTIILEKIDNVMNQVNNIDFTTLNDEKIARLMTLNQLISEIKED